jgi:hypothetical protein
MAKHVKISVIGAANLADCRGSDPSAVDRMIAHWQAQLDQVLPDRPDLIVLPEFCDMCASDTLDEYRDFCIARGDRMLDFFSNIARQHNLWITYPALHQTADNPWKNSIRLINRHGRVAGSYAKTCPTIGEIEAGIDPGCDVTTIQTDFGRVAMAICFDLNFDELRKRVAAESPDLILFCSMYHGGLMQEYWAYSCRAHFAAAVTNLPSRIISPLGQTIATTTNYMNHVTTTVNLDCQLVHLDYHAEKLRDLKRKYGPGVTIRDPGLLAPVLVTSEIEGVTAEAMLREFKIEPLDDYLDRSRQAQQKQRDCPSPMNRASHPRTNSSVAAVLKHE